MRIIGHVLLTCLSLATVVAWRSHHRIVGGKTAMRGQFPFMVSIQNVLGHVCGGSIVSKYYVLTAAHCLGDADARSFKIYLGSNDLKSKGTYNPVKRIILFPGWSSHQPIIDDIALIKTVKEMRTSQFVKAIALPPSNQSVRIGTPVTSAGWGLTQLEPPVRPNQLQYLETNVTRNILCSINNNVICAGAVKGHDMCLVDSGAPLIYKDMVVGVLSHLTPCAVKKPTFFTKVASYRGWIDSEMKK